MNATTVSGQNVFVVGNTAALGSWDTSKAIAPSSASYPVWKATVSLPSGTAVEYKYVRKNADGSVTWESAGESHDDAVRVVVHAHRHLAQLIRRPLGAGPRPTNGTTMRTRLTPALADHLVADGRQQGTTGEPSTPSTSSSSAP